MDIMLNLIPICPQSMSCLTKLILLKVYNDSAVIGFLSLARMMITCLGFVLYWVMSPPALMIICPSAFWAVSSERSISSDTRACASRWLTGAEDEAFLTWTKMPSLRRTSQVSMPEGFVPGRINCLSRHNPPIAFASFLLYVSSLLIFFNCSSVYLSLSLWISQSGILLMWAFLLNISVTLFCIFWIYGSSMEYHWLFCR